MKIKLSVVVITYNEAGNIARCITSVSKIADEVLLIDSFSTDETQPIAESLGARVVHNKFEGHIEQKNFALSQAANDYVLSLDADECLSEELLKSIAEIKNDWTHDAYFFNRLNNYCGQWIRYGAWYPDRKTRLVDRRKGRWGGYNPHDQIILNDGASIKKLNGDLLHYSFNSVAEHVAQINYFSDIIAYEGWKKREVSFPLQVVLNPFFSFLRDYLFRLGFLDGKYGFIISINVSFGKYLKYAKLHMLKQNPPAHNTYASVKSKRNF